MVSFSYLAVKNCRSIFHVRQKLPSTGAFFLLYNSRRKEEKAIRKEYIFLLLTAVYGAVWDCRTGSIPRKPLRLLMLFRLMLLAVEGIRRIFTEGTAFCDLLSEYVIFLAGLLLIFLLLFPFWKKGFLGAGDIRLFLCLGAFSGFPFIFSLLWYSLLSAAIYSVLYLFYYGAILHRRPLSSFFSTGIRLGIPVFIAVVVFVIRRMIGSYAGGSI